LLDLFKFVSHLSVASLIAPDHWCTFWWIWSRCCLH